MSYRTGQNMSKITPQLHNISVQVDSDIEIRTETYLGREWTVIPVVAMVEGVRFGANQDNPELGLASEFGESPILWNNRPIVLNHPKVDGVFVSANQSIEVLDDWAFGITMNAQVDEDKLKMEAWIDNVRVEELGGEFEEILSEITEGEDPVEVSVGFFSTLEEKKGKFRGQAYSGIWRQIRPDHLAILSLGNRGACSNEDGCGIPRINEVNQMSTPAKPTLKADNAKPATQCKCGGHHAETEHVEPSSTVSAQENVSEEAAIEVLEAETRSETRSTIQKLVDQMVGGGLIDSDIRKVILRALQKRFNSYTYLYGYTNEFCIYERYNYSEPYGYATYRLGINVSNEGKVEFVGEPEEVILLTKIVAQESNTDLVSQSSKPEVPAQENDMTTENKAPATPEAVVQSADQIAEAARAAEAAKPAAVVQAVEPPKKLSAQEYVDQAPPEVREMLQSGLKAHNDRKAAAIASIKANSKNKFSDQALGEMSIEALENLVELSGGEVSYAGRQAPAAPITQAQGSQFVAAPKVFTPKAAVAA